MFIAQFHYIKILEYHPLWNKKKFSRQTNLSDRLICKVVWKPLFFLTRDTILLCQRDHKISEKKTLYDYIILCYSRNKLFLFAHLFKLTLQKKKTLLFGSKSFRAIFCCFWFQYSYRRKKKNKRKREREREMRNGKRQTMRSRLNPHNNNLAYIEIGRSRAHILISSYTFQFVRSFVCVFACAMYIYNFHFDEWSRTC